MSVFRVISKNGKELFAGLEKDAREFVERNFPRPHADANGNLTEPDAVLVSQDGDKDTYHGPESGWKSQQVNEDSGTDSKVEESEPTKSSDNDGSDEL